MRGVKADYPNLPTCSGTSLFCMNEIFSKIGKYKTINETGQVCMPACEDQVYQMAVTSSAFPNRATFPKREEQCLLILKLRVRSGDIINDYEDSGLDPKTEALLEHMLFKYAKENLVVVNIYIKVRTFIVCFGSKIKCMCCIYVGEIDFEFCDKG